jgi:hypothetical protein
MSYAICVESFGYSLRPAVSWKRSSTSGITGSNPLLHYEKQGGVMDTEREMQIALSFGMAFLAHVTILQLAIHKIAVRFVKTNFKAMSYSCIRVCRP